VTKPLPWVMGTIRSLEPGRRAECDIESGSGRELKARRT